MSRVFLVRREGSLYRTRPFARRGDCCMCMRAPSSFPNHFASLSDPRSFHAPNQRHELIDTLVMAICAVIRGAQPSCRGPRPALLSQTPRYPRSGSRLVLPTPALTSDFWPMLVPAAAPWGAAGLPETSRSPISPGREVSPHGHGGRAAPDWPVDSDPGVRPRRTPNPIIERPL
jgi:hypothetical protein